MDHSKELYLNNIYNEITNSKEPNYIKQNILKLFSDFPYAINYPLDEQAKTVIYNENAFNNYIYIDISLYDNNI